MKLATLADLKDAAEHMIDHKEDIARGVAATMGYLIADVKEHGYFRDRVMRTLTQIDAKYAHLEEEFAQYMATKRPHLVHAYVAALEVAPSAPKQRMAAGL